ncbi:MAG: oligosaccharide flippase family protein [Paludibacteraceae bacterium]|nr:oligosaccharide flippase family protein [Paludibacteraceae bacterium]
MKRYIVNILNVLNKIKEGGNIVNGLLFSIYSFINRGISFFLLLILANYITPEEYGYLSLWGTVVSIVGYFISLSSDGYMEISYFKNSKEGIANSFSGVLTIMFIIGGLFILLLVMFGENISNILNLPISSLYLAVVISFFTVLSNLNLNLFRIQEKVQMYGFLSVTNAVLNFILSVIFVKYFLFGWFGRTCAQSLCSVIYGFLGFIIFVRNKYFIKPNWHFLKNMLIWGIPLIPHLATNFIRQGCDRYIINSTHSVEYVGLFSFALNIANIIIMVGLGFNQSNSVDIYKVLGNKTMSNHDKKLHLRKQRLYIGLIYGVISLIVLLFSYFIIPLLLPNYENFKNYFAILSIYAFFQCMYYLYTNYLFYYNKTHLIMYVTFFSSLLHLLLSLLFTRYSLYYTCFIYCLSQFLVFLIIKYYANRELNNKLG